MIIIATTITISTETSVFKMRLQVVHEEQQEEHPVKEAPGDCPVQAPTATKTPTATRTITAAAKTILMATVVTIEMAIEMDRIDHK